MVTKLTPEEQILVNAGYEAGQSSMISEIRQLEAKLQEAVEALEHYDTTCYDGHDYSAKEISKYAREAIEKIKGASNEY